MNPIRISQRLLQLPQLPPGPHLLPATLHATHALSIPVRLGVEYVARSHSFVWSIQHALCGLEFAVFLSKWLYCINSKEKPLDGKLLYRTSLQNYVLFILAFPG